MTSSCSVSPCHQVGRGLREVTWSQFNLSPGSGNILALTPGAVITRCVIRKIVLRLNRTTANYSLTCWATTMDPMRCRSTLRRTISMRTNAAWRIPWQQTDSVMSFVWHGSVMGGETGLLRFGFSFLGTFIAPTIAVRRTTQPRF